MIQRQTMTAHEAAAYLGVSKDLVYSMSRAGELPAVRIGRRVLFRREALDRWMQAQEMRSQTAATYEQREDEPNLAVLFEGKEKRLT